MKKWYFAAICVCCLMLHFCGCGLVTTSLSVYLPYLKESLNLSNTEISAVTTIRCLSTTIFMSIAGLYYRKVSLRVGVVIAQLFLVLGCLVFSQATSVYICYAAAVFMGIPYALGAMLPITLIINNWFISYKSTALAIATCGSSLCTVVAPPLITLLIESFGIVKTLLVESCFIVLCAIILFFVLRDRPSDLSMEPYRAQERKLQNRQVNARNSPLTNTNQLILLSAMFLVGFAGSPYMSSLMIHFTTSGYPSMWGASALSILGAVMAAGKFLCGALSDRLGAYRINYIFLGSWMAGALLTAAAGRMLSIPILYTSAVLGGIGLPIGSIGMTVWAGDLSSPEQYAHVVHIGQTAFTLGSLLGTPLPGILADVAGSYISVYILYAVLFAGILIIIQSLYHRQSTCAAVADTVS